MKIRIKAAVLALMFTVIGTGMGSGTKPKKVYNYPLIFKNSVNHPTYKNTEFNDFIGENSDNSFMGTQKLLLLTQGYNLMKIVLTPVDLTKVVCAWIGKADGYVETSKRLGLGGLALAGHTAFYCGLAYFTCCLGKWSMEKSAKVGWRTIKSIWRGIWNTKNQNNGNGNNNNNRIPIQFNNWNG